MKYTPVVHKDLFTNILQNKNYGFLKSVNGIQYKKGQAAFFNSLPSVSAFLYYDLALERA